MNVAGYRPLPRASTPRPPAAAWVAALLGVAALALYDIGGLDLWDPDEANYAEIAREMSLSGDWVVPHSNYRPYLEKPPLVFWLGAALLGAGADGEAAARLPAAVAGLILLAACALWAQRALPSGAALHATLALGTSFGFLATSRLGILDLPLTCCVTVSLLGFERRVLSGGGRLAWLAFYAGMAAGCLVKGPLGAALPIACAVLSAAWVRPADLLARLDPVRGSLLFLALSAPWYMLVEARTPGFLSGFLVDHHLLRYVGDGIEHRRPLPRGSYVPLLVLAGIPWVIFWPRAVAGAWRGMRARDPVATLLGIGAALPLLFFTLSATRLAQYALPSLPSLALLTARELAARGTKLRCTLLVALAGALLFVSAERRLAAPLNARRSLRPLAQEAAARALPGEPILSYRLGKPYASVYYSGRRVRFIEEEVTFDQFVSSPRRFWILLDEPERLALERRQRRAFPPLAAHSGRCLITNRPSAGWPEP